MYNEDIMDFPSWGKKKVDFKGNGLPVVTLSDGMQLAESGPTSIYYGKLFGQYPRDPAMAHMMEMLMAQYMDCFNAYTPAHMAKDDAKIKEVIEGKIAVFLAKLEPMLAKMKFICGEKLTVIDFWVGAMYCDRCANPNLDNP